MLSSLKIPKLDYDRYHKFMSSTGILLYFLSHLFVIAVLHTSGNNSIVLKGLEVSISDIAILMMIFDFFLGLGLLISGLFVWRDSSERERKRARDERYKQGYESGEEEQDIDPDPATEEGNFSEGDEDEFREGYDG